MVGRLRILALAGDAQEGIPAQQGPMQGRGAESFLLQIREIFLLVPEL